MDRTLRNFLAVTLAPLVVPVVLSFVLSSIDYGGGATTVVFFSSLFLAYLGMIALGLPVFLFCKRRGLTSAWMAALMGFLIGGIVCLLFFTAFGVMLGLNPSLSRSIVIQWMVGMASLGAVVGLVFWLIARPDTANDRSGSPVG